MKPYIVIDIETCKLPEGRIRKNLPDFSAPSHYENEEKIAGNIAKKEERFIESKASFDPFSSRPVIIGFRFPDGKHASLNSNENDDAAMARNLDAAWWMIEEALAKQQRIVGHWHTRFDIPYLRQVSFILDVQIPDKVKPGLWLNPLFFDIAVDFEGGNRERSFSLARMHYGFFGVGKEVTGADFEYLWKRDRARAIEYSRNDLELISNCYQRMMKDM